MSEILLPWRTMRSAPSTPGLSGSWEVASRSQMDSSSCCLAYLCLSSPLLRLVLSSSLRGEGLCWALTLALQGHFSQMF